MEEDELGMILVVVMVVMLLVVVEEGLRVGLRRRLSALSKRLSDAVLEQPGSPGKRHMTYCSHQ